MRSKSSFADRIKKLQQTLDTDGYILTCPLALFYLTGLSLSKGELFIGKKQCRLFVDGRYIQAALKNGLMPAELFEKKEAFYKKEKLKSVGFDSGATRYSQFMQMEAFARKMGWRLVPVSHAVEALRAIKDKEELHKLRVSARHAWRAFNHIKKLIRPGVAEAELALEFTLFGLEHGADSVGFEPIIAFGENGALPHHRAGKKRWKKGEPVLMDLGLVVNKYHSDMTRVLLFDTKEPIVKKFYTVVRRAHAAALKLCRPGVSLKEIDLAARQEMRKENVEDYFVHGLGHGVGLEIHEFPRIIHTGQDKNVILEEGMAVTIEPGLYLPGKGGVRWEDTILITAKGYENLYPEGRG